MTPKRKKDREEPKPVPSLGGVEGNSLFEQVWDPENDQHYFLIYDMTHPDKPPVRSHSFEPTIDKIYIPWVTDFARKGILYLPSKVEEYGSDDELWNEQREFIHDYCDMSHEDLLINVQYIALTWIFDKFNEVSYRRFLGDWGTGKSRSLQAIGACCYHPVIIKAASTPASIFRTVEQTRGTLLIDEAHFDKKGDIWSAMMGILNAGYEVMGGIIRCGKEEYNLEAFMAFGPKVLASRIPFPDRALESRCLTCITYQTHRPDIPPNIPPEFFGRALHLRNKWLLWRFRNWHRQISPSPAILELIHVIPRLRQIIAPLAAIRPHDGFFVEYIKRKHDEIIEERRQSWEGQVLQAIQELYYDPERVDLDGKPVISIADIAERYRSNQGIADQKDFTPSKCGHIIRRLGFDTERRRVGKRNAFVMVWSPDIFERRCKDYGLNDGGQVTAVTKVTEVTQLTDFTPKTGENGNIGNPGNSGNLRATEKTSQKTLIKMVLEAIKPIMDQERCFYYSDLVHNCEKKYGANHDQVNTIVEHLREKGRIVKICEGRYQLV